MFAEVYMAGHESFDGFVRIEESICAEQKRKSGCECARGDESERNKACPKRGRRVRGRPSRRGHAVLWPRMDFDQLMLAALSEARLALDASEVPIGAVVAMNGEIIGRGFNQPIRSVDPTAHAEIAALRQAAARVGNYRLSGTTLCVTIEPCLMCVGAMVHARIGTLVYGAAEPRTGAIVSTVRGAELPGHNHRFEIVAGVREDECRSLIVEFFKQRR